MAYMVVDGQNQWNYQPNSQQVTDTNISVTMSTNNGLNAVASGPTRQGSVVADAQQYPVTLPGSFSGMLVTFRRR